MGKVLSNENQKMSLILAVEGIDDSLVSDNAMKEKLGAQRLPRSFVPKFRSSKDGMFPSYMRECQVVALDVQLPILSRVGMMTHRYTPEGVPNGCS